MTRSPSNLSCSSLTLLNSLSFSAISSLSFSISSSHFFSFSSYSSTISFTVGLFFTDLALNANLSVDNDW